MSHIHFADALLAACTSKDSRLVVGLDPHPGMLPPHLLAEYQAAGATDAKREAMAKAILEFNTAIIEAVADHSVAVKPQLAFYEQWGSAGMAAYEATVEAAHRAGLLVIADGKRNDIGSSAEGYAAAYLGSVTSDNNPSLFEADALTINPYLGSDGITPFTLRSTRGKGAFALVRTSNPSAAQVQNLLVGGTPLFLKVAELVRAWGADYIGQQGYSSLGAVVGATDPSAARALRRAMPQTLFLVPGFGAQGASGADVAAAFDANGLGAVVNSSREVVFAYKRTGEYKSYAMAAREAARVAKENINEALRS